MRAYAQNADFADYTQIKGSAELRRCKKKRIIQMFLQPEYRPSLAESVSGIYH